MNVLIFHLKYFIYEMKLLSDKSINIIIEMKSVINEMKNTSCKLKVINIETVDNQLITFIKLLILFRTKGCNKKVNNRTFTDKYLSKLLSNF